MKKTLISVGLYCSILLGASINTKAQSLAQYQPKTAIKVGDKTTLAKPQDQVTGLKSLKLNEINLVNSYYVQDGNNAAVTGGTGSEELWNIATGLDLKLSFLDKKKNKHSITADAAFDYYSSASSDMIDARTVSSASKDDLHFYPNINWNVKNEIKKTTIGAGLAYSTEWDYKSIGGNMSFTKASKDNNTEVSIKAGAFFDTWSVILPSELRPAGYPSGAEGDQEGLDYKKRNSYNISISIAQIINKRLQIMATIEPAMQEGLLSTPFHRVYFTDGTLKVEKLPGERFKLPTSIRANYFLGDKIILRSMYRFYADSWGMKAHTINLESTYKINSFLSITPHYRFSNQGKVKYFAPYKEHNLTSQYYTSDYDISNFNSAFWGAGIRIAPPGGVFGLRFYNALEFRYGHYNRSSGLNANSFSLAMKFTP